MIDPRVEAAATEAERVSVEQCSNDLIRFAEGLTTYQCPRCETIVTGIQQFPVPLCPHGHFHTPMREVRAARAPVTIATDAWLVAYLPILRRAVACYLDTFDANFDPPVGPAEGVLD